MVFFRIRRYYWLSSCIDNLPKPAHSAGGRGAKMRKARNQFKTHIRPLFTWLLYICTVYTSYTSHTHIRTHHTDAFCSFSIVSPRACNFRLFSCTRILRHTTYLYICVYVCVACVRVCACKTTWQAVIYYTNSLESSFSLFLRGCVLIHTYS